MNNLQLKLEKRDGIGSNKVSKLRNEGLVPGIIYGKNEEPINVYGKENELMKISDEAGTSVLVDVEIDGEAKTVLFKDIQMHPFKNRMLHFDLIGVNLNEAIKVIVPVILENRDNIRVQPSVLMQNLDEVEIECLPKYLPSEALVDVENMQIGDNITIADLDIAKDENITILTEEEEVIATLAEPQEEVIEEEVGDVDAADVPTVDETEDDSEEATEE